MTRSDRRARAALAAAAFALVAPAAYMAQRAVEVLRGPAIDPVAVVASTHTALYWRAAIGAWIGVVAAIATFASIARTERAAAVLAAITLPVTALIALAAWWMP